MQHPWSTPQRLAVMSETGLLPDTGEATPALSLGRATATHDHASFAADAIACLYLRHERHDLPWADFLSAAADIARTHPGYVDPSTFETPLREFEGSDRSPVLEDLQTRIVRAEHAQAIDAIRRTLADLQ